MAEKKPDDENVIPNHDITPDINIKIGLLIIETLNKGVSYSEVKEIVSSYGLTSSYVDAIISLDHHIMTCRSKNLSDETILANVVAKGWPKEIVQELLKDIDKRLRNSKN